MEKNSRRFRDTLYTRCEISPGRSRALRTRTRYDVSFIIFFRNLPDVHEFLSHGLRNGAARRGRTRIRAFAGLVSFNNIDHNRAYPTSV